MIPWSPAKGSKFNSIARDSHVNLSIYNVNGQLVRTLVDEFEAQDRYSVEWDGRDNAGKAVASGVYFYRIRTEHFSGAKKLILLR